MNVMKSDNIVPLYRDNVILDVTVFDARPSDPIGYLCGAEIMLFDDGTVIFCNGKEEVDRFHVSDLVRVNANINNYDPDHDTEIAIITPEKSFRIIFSDGKKKKAFVDSLDIIFTREVKFEVVKNESKWK